MDDEVFSVTQIFGILRKHILLILSMTIIGAVLAAGVSYFVMTPKYQSSSLMLVNRKADSNNAMQYEQVQTDIQMINTYKDIITKPVILNQVKKDLTAKGYKPGTTSELEKSISLTNNTNSQVVNVSAKSTDPYLARAIADDVVTVFSKKILTIMSNAKNVSVISKGTLNKTPVSPKPKINIAIGLIVGLLIGILIAFIRELTDKTVKDTAFITDTMHLPLLGTISDMQRGEMKLGHVHSKKTSRRAIR